MKPKYELADILNLYGNEFMQKERLPAYKVHVLNSIKLCRTSFYGGHVDKCEECGHIRISYNSCGNRHCPKCQGIKKEKWIMAREADLLPIKYFHVVFTIPAVLNKIFLNNQKQMYDLLFQSAWSVIKSFAADKKHLGAKTGMISILHTNGQNLSYHPHIHCIVPGGGIDDAGKWKNTRGKGKFLFPVKAMSQVYRARFVAGLRKFAKAEAIKLSKELTDKLFDTEWVVYAKRPFAGVKPVIEYLGRYTHRVAISNHRLIDIDNGKVKFSIKNYKKGGRKEVCELSADEFLRRFCLHILPQKFLKIRHHGILSNRNKKKSLEIARKSLKVKAPERKNSDWKTILFEKYGVETDICPKCKKGKMIQIEKLERGQKYYPLE